MKETKCQPPRASQRRSGLLALLHHHAPYRLAPERKGRLPSPIRLDFELLVLTHHLEELVVHLTGRVAAVGGREAERDDCGSRARVRVLAAHGEAGCVGHAVKLRAMLGRCDGCVGLMRAC